MRPLMSTAVVLLLILGARLCPAAEEAAPQTGTIEVEVVYKDTGEPVEGVLATLTCDDAYLGWTVPERGRASFELRPSNTGRTHEVALWHRPPHWARPEVVSSTFLRREASCERSVTLSAEQAVASVVFEIERGWELRGRVRLEDGSALADGVVIVEQAGGPEANAFGMTDDTGSFAMLGVAPGETAQLRAFSVLDIDTSPAAIGYIPLRSEAVMLEGESTSVDLEVRSIALTLVVDVAKPVWPFPAAENLGDLRARIWVGADVATTNEDADAMIWLSTLDPVRVPGLPKDRYRVELPHFPPDETVTIVVETREYEPSPSIASRRGSVEVTVTGGIDASSARVVAQTQLSIELGSTDQELRIVHYEPNARLSHLFWYGVPPLIVLVVCVPILVWQVRKRRAKESA